MHEHEWERISDNKARCSVCGIYHSRGSFRAAEWEEMPFSGEAMPPSGGEEDEEDEEKTPFVADEEGTEEVVDNDLLTDPVID